MANLSVRVAHRRCLTALALLLASCAAPYESTVPCSPAFPYRDGWLGGDGAYSVPLARGETLWLFGDTFVGTAGAADRRKARFIHNSIALSRCGARGWEIEYAWGRGDDGRPRAFFEAASDEAYWWPFDGFEHEGRLYVGLISVEPTPPRGPFGLPFRFSGMALARIDQPDAEPERWAPTILALSSSEDAFPGSALVVHEEHLYLFAFFDHNAAHYPRMLARLPLRALDAPEPAAALETFAKDGSWQPGFVPKRARVLMDDDATEMSVRYDAKRSAWLAVYGYPPSDRVVVRTAPSLEGPWSAPRTIFRIPELDPRFASGHDPDTFCYAAKEHPQYASAGRLWLTYVCNLFTPPGEDPWESLERLQRSMYLYRPPSGLDPLSDAADRTGRGGRRTRPLTAQRAGGQTARSARPERTAGGDTVTDLSKLPVVDVDSHWTEPPDLWTSRAPAHLRDRAMRVVRNEAGVEQWVVEDGQVMGSVGFCSIKRDGSKTQASIALDTFDEVHPGAIEVPPRLAYMDEHGLDVQIVYPNILGFAGNGVMRIQDAEHRAFCVTAYNDAAGDMQAESAGRLFPQAMLPFWDIPASVRELERCHDALGLTGFVVTDATADWGLPALSDPTWDPLWACAQERGLPVNFHIGAGLITPRTWEPYSPARLFAALSTMAQMSNMATIANLIFSGLLDRFPRLKFVSVESGSGWLPFLLESLDYQFDENGVTDLALRPSEYFQRQIYGSYWFEKDLAPAIDKLGEDNLMFETDFPHATCLYPKVRDQIQDSLEGLAPRVQRKLLYENAVRVYGLPLP